MHGGFSDYALVFVHVSSIAFTNTFNSLNPPNTHNSLVHELLTKRGKAMHTIQNHLMNSLKDGCSNWDEPEQLKHVGNRTRISY